MNGECVDCENLSSPITHKIHLLIKHVPIFLYSSFLSWFQTLTHLFQTHPLIHSDFSSLFPLTQVYALIHLLLFFHTHSPIMKLNHSKINNYKLDSFVQSFITHSFIQPQLRFSSCSLIHSLFTPSLKLYILYTLFTHSLLFSSSLSLSHSRSHTNSVILSKSRDCTVQSATRKH